MALINIASDKQLFADNYLIESLKDARQVMNPAKKLESNPILWPEKPWEGDYLGVSDVWFDHADQVFKMFYRPATHRAYLTPDGTLAADAPTDDDPITALPGPLGRWHQLGKAGPGPGRVSGLKKEQSSSRRCLHALLLPGPARRGPRANATRA